MTLVNDLVRIIAIYGPWEETWRLLTITPEISRVCYNPNDILWKQKSEVEHHDATAACTKLQEPSLPKYFTLTKNHYGSWVHIRRGRESQSLDVRAYDLRLTWGRTSDTLNMYIVAEEGITIRTYNKPDHAPELVKSRYIDGTRGDRIVSPNLIIPIAVDAGRLILLNTNNEGDLVLLTERGDIKVYSDGSAPVQGAHKVVVPDDKIVDYAKDANVFIDRMHAKWKLVLRDQKYMMIKAPPDRPRAIREPVPLYPLNSSDKCSAFATLDKNRTVKIVGKSGLELGNNQAVDQWRNALDKYAGSIQYLNTNDYSINILCDE